MSKLHTQLLVVHFNSLVWVPTYVDLSRSHYLMRYRYFEKMNVLLCLRRIPEMSSMPGRTPGMGEVPSKYTYV